MADLIIIEALGSGNGLALVETAVHVGVNVVFATSGPQRYAHDLRRSLLEDPPSNLLVLSGVDTTDPAALETLLRGEHGRGAAVVSQVDRTILATAEACARTGHAFLAPEVVRRCVDKSLFRRTLAAAGLPGPVSAVANSPSELAETARLVGTPAVVKPARGTGSLGVRLAWTFEEILQHGRILLAQRSAAQVESYLLGPLVSLEVFRHEGATLVLGATDRVLSDPPFFAELCWTFPLTLASANHERLVSAASTLLDAIGFASGPAHVEFVWTADGPVAIEVNPRIAGRGLTAMVSGLSAYDEYELIVSQALGRPLPSAREPARDTFLSECVVTGPRGAVPSAEAINAVSSIPGVVHVRLSDPTTAPQAYADLSDLGEVRASGSSFGEAQMRARAAAQALKATVSAAPQEAAAAQLVTTGNGSAR